jgi:hypothetical protein
MLIKFGEPISLKQYYDEYRESPRETMVKINTIVRNRIQEMMLHIEDLENYNAIDFIRESEYGKKFAIKHGYKHAFLPSRLLSDQKLVDALQSAHKEHPEEMEEVYRDTNEYAEGLKRLNIRDWLYIHNPGIATVILRALGLLLLLPLFLISIIPTGLLFIIPKLFLKRLIKDQMFVSSFNIGVSAFITVPLCLIIPIVLLWVFSGFWWALGYFIAFPLMFVLAWNYMRIWQKFIGSCNFVARSNRNEVKRLGKLRSSIHERLNRLLNN